MHSTPTGGAGALIVPDGRPPIPGGGPQSVADVLDSVADRTRVAVIGRSGRLTYDELDRAANRVAHTLIDAGTRPGDRVGASLPNDLDIVVAFLGAMRIGAIWVGIPRVLATAEKAYVTHDTEMSLLLADPVVAEECRQRSDEFAPGLQVLTVGEAGWHDRLAAASDQRPETPVDPFAPAAISHTSGTTGRPKGVVHSQHNLLVPGAVAVMAGEFPPDGPVATSAPMTILNLFVLVPLTAFQAGTSCVIMDSNDPVSIAEWIASEKIMHLTVVPTVYHDLLDAPTVTADQLASLLRPRSGGAAVTETLRARWLERFGRRLTSSLAMTEAPTYVAREDPSEPRLEGSLGRAVSHVQITIVDTDDRPVPTGGVGEICVSPATDGPWAGVYTPMFGYWGQPDETQHTLRGEKLHSGDMGRFDEDGNLFLVDRKSSLIIRGGSNIYPAEVERVLHLDPRVDECVLIPKPDERLGEITVAFVRLAAGASAQVDELKAHCAGHLARYKVPDEIRLVDDFPRTALGKPHRSELARSLRATNEMGAQ
ncbi:MAG: class I adenylate-forming enzyme family protein [Actinomycetota bacterium]|nr:class I adenylate-forming enzyme family protein [Actinomycetota bacterium]